MSERRSSGHRIRIGLMLRAWGESGGVGVYTRNLVRELLDLESRIGRHGEDGPAITWRLLWRSAEDARDAARFFARAHVEEQVENHVLPVPSIPLLGKAMWDQVAVPLAARGLDALLHPKFTAPFLAPCPVVMTVHGADWWRPEEARFYSRLDRAYIRATMPLYFRRCAAVVSVSEQSTRGFVRALGEPVAPKLHTVPFGPARHFAPIEDRSTIEAARRRYRLPERYLLTLAKPSALARKNVDGLVAGYRLYAESRAKPGARPLAEPSAEPLPLVIGGPEPERMRRRLLGDAGDAKEAGTILFPGRFEQHDLPAVHGGAELFVYPSHLEAFPIPLAEAMACGTPIVTSDREGPREIAGDAARYVDPDDPGALARELARLVDDAAARAELSRRGLERAKLFSWPRAAARVREILLEVACSDRARR